MGYQVFTSLLFLEISVHLGTPTIILSLQTFSKDDQIALLEKSISSVIAYVPRALWEERNSRKMDSTIPNPKRYTEFVREARQGTITK